MGTFYIRFYPPCKNNMDSIHPTKCTYTHTQSVHIYYILFYCLLFLAYNSPIFYLIEPKFIKKLCLGTFYHSQFKNNKKRLKLKMFLLFYIFSIVLYCLAHNSPNVCLVELKIGQRLCFGTFYPSTDRNHQ